MLFIVGTPIGNLDDISLRALKVLKQVDYILCEDTRRTKILLNKYKINNKLISYFEHSKHKKIDSIINLLLEGKVLALVSEAGTPGISDPGNRLIKEILKRDINVKISPVPGPSAITALLSVSGLPCNKFIFYGFLPKKNKRKKLLEEILKSDITSVFYESPYRIKDTLNDLYNLYNKLDKLINKKIVIGRELTKIFEDIYYFTLAEIKDKLPEIKSKGEFTIAIGK